MVDEKPDQELDLEGLKAKLGADEEVEAVANVKAKLELLPDDDVADLSPMGVDAGTIHDKTPKVACMTCEMVGPYKQEDKKMKARGKRKAITFQIMRMTECGHGIVYGVMTTSVLEMIEAAKKFQALYIKLAKAGDQSGAQRSYHKFGNSVKRIQARQRAAWKTNQHRIKLDAIPELADAS